MTDDQITLRQKDVFYAAFAGHPNVSEVMRAVRLLSKKQASDIITSFHGYSWNQSKVNPNEDLRAAAKAKLNNALLLLGDYYRPTCKLCKQPRLTCTC